MKRRSIQSLLKLNAGLSLGLMLALGTGSGVAMLKLDNAVNSTIVSFNAVRVQMDADMMHDALRGDVLEAIKLQLTSNTAALGAVQVAVQEHGQRLLSNLKENRDNTSDPALINSINQVTEVANRYVNAASLFVKQASVSAPTEAQWAAFMDDFSSLEASMEALSDQLASQASVAKALSSSILHNSIAGILALLVLALSVLFLMGRHLGLSIGRPLNNLAHVVTRVEREGDLTLRAENRDNNEIGDVIIAFNALMASLQNIVQGVHTSSLELAKASSNLGTAAEKSIASSQSNSDAAASVAAAVEELSVSVTSISSQALLADESSRQSVSLAQQATLSTDKAGNEMRNISAFVQQSASTLVDLQEQVRGISEIAGAIQSIAQQTNLLALNAAIEAARAGEQGRGFAVVADEVRVLAERTSDSTLKIGSIIDAIQTGTQEAVSQMETGAERVERGVQITEEVIRHIQGVTDLARKTSLAITGISESLREQEAAGQDIAKSIERVATTSEENYSVAKDTAQVADALLGLSTRLEGQVTQFSRL